MSHDECNDAINNLSEQLRTAQAEIERLNIYIHQLRGLLGYPVPGNIQKNPNIKNGIAEALQAKNAALLKDRNEWREIAVRYKFKIQNLTVKLERVSQVIVDVWGQAELNKILDGEDGGEMKLDDIERLIEAYQRNATSALSLKNALVKLEAENAALRSKLERVMEKIDTIIGAMDNDRGIWVGRGILEEIIQILDGEALESSDRKRC